MVHLSHSHESPLRVLGVFPHPDDEAYAISGTFARLSAAGVQVRLVCATNGEAGTHRTDKAIVGEELARVRREELGASAQLMGASSLDFLGFPDGGLSHIPRQTLVGALAEKLDGYQPHIVVTLGEDGVYGHRDHVVLTDALFEVFQLERFSKARLLYCLFPKGLFSPLYKVLRKGANHLLHERVSRESLGAEREACDWVVDVSSVAKTKRACIEAHASQLLDARAETFLLPGLQEHMLQEEWFKCVAGPVWDHQVDAWLGAD